MERAVGHRLVYLAVGESHGDAGTLEAGDGRQEGTADLLGHRVFAAWVALAGKVAVEDDLHIHPSGLRMEERVDHAVAVLTAKLVDEKEAGADGAAGAADLGQDGVVRPVGPAVEHGLAAEGVEQVEGAERIDPVALDHSAAHALEDVVK